MRDKSLIISQVFYECLLNIHVEVYLHCGRDST